MDQLTRKYGAKVADLVIRVYPMNSRKGFSKAAEPKDHYQEDGRVVVEIYVDRSGKVTQAIPGVKGSTTLNEYLLKVAKDAAMKASFDPKI